MLHHCRFGKSSNEDHACKLSLPVKPKLVSHTYVVDGPEDQSVELPMPLIPKKSLTASEISGATGPSALRSAGLFREQDVSFAVSPLPVQQAKINQEKLKSVPHDHKWMVPTSLTLVDNADGGDCLFLAVAAQTEEPATELRQLLQVAIDSSKEALRPLVEADGADIRLIHHESPLEGELVSDIDRYIQLIAFPGTWGGQIELAVIAQVLHRPIALITPGYRPMAYPSSVNGASHAAYEGEPIFIHYNGHNHYQALALENPLHDKIALFQIILTQANEEYFAAEDTAIAMPKQRSI